METHNELILALATSSPLAAASKNLLTSDTLAVEMFSFINAIPSPFLDPLNSELTKNVFRGFNQLFTYQQLRPN